MPMGWPQAIDVGQPQLLFTEQSLVRDRHGSNIGSLARCLKWMTSGSSASLTRITNPLGDFGPGILQGARTHEEADVPAWDEPQILLGVEDPFPSRDVVGFA